MLRSLLSALPLLLATTASAVETPPVPPYDWGPDTPLMLDDPKSMVARIQAGDIFVADATLASLLNEEPRNANAPVRNLKLSTRADGQEVHGELPRKGRWRRVAGILWQWEFPLMFTTGVEMAQLPLAMIAALAENRVIGVDNRLPWHLPEDLKHFKAMTLGKPVIMGRKTWDSLGRPLPGRLNIVVTRQTGLTLEGAEVFTSLDAALERAAQWAEQEEAEELMLIGGAQLYSEALSRADRLYLTRVGLSPKGDAHFPEVNESQWYLASSIEHDAEGETPAYAFEVWERA